MFLRYKFQPESVNHYTITVKPHWWQTFLFKLLLSLTVLTIMVVLLFYFFQKNKLQQLQKKENEKKQAKLELKAIYAQLNPHFIFNALNSIQGLINKSEVTQANMYLTEFSSLLRESLKNNDKDFIPLHTEIKTLVAYLTLEKLRFRFNYSFNVDTHLNADAIEIPSLFFQPLVENAIKHGVAPLRESGQIDINFYQNNKDLKVDISDNGQGFNPAIPCQGFGLKLTKERIQLLNLTLKEQPVTLTIESTSTKGTIVHLTFENWL